MRGTVLAALLALPLLASGDPEPPLDRLGWLAGCWEIRSGERRVEEQWMEPRGALMLGMSRTTVRDTVREHEHLAIRAEGGRLVYAARPSGQAPAEFASTHVSADSVVFADPAHDFPQRIVYRRAAGGDSLQARIEGTLGGSARAVAFPYGRVRCPGGGASP